MIKHITRAFLPFVVTGIILSAVIFLPKNAKVIESSISPDMPLHYDLPGWHGVRTQESKQERAILAKDTRFSKAIYRLLPRVPWETSSPRINVSIVYSGKDLNNSIHRPEICLPAQGHMNLQGKASLIQLSNGKVLKFTRLQSTIPTNELKSKRLHYIHYYIFVGHSVICHTHMQRTFQDILTRCFLGRVQSWAYFQAGTCWSPEIGITEEEADTHLRKLISELLPGLIHWEALE